MARRTAGEGIAIPRYGEKTRLFCNQWESRRTKDTSPTGDVVKDYQKDRRRPFGDPGPISQNASPQSAQEGLLKILVLANIDVEER